MCVRETERKEGEENERKWVCVREKKESVERGLLVRY